MEGDGSQPQIWAVAGCLFEVSVAEDAGSPWQFDGSAAGTGMTLLGESVRAGRRHFRFRAEAEAVGAGEVQLRFRMQSAQRGRVLRTVPVHVAPEADPGG